VLLALDRMPSVHSFDKDGRLRVRAVPISRVGISVYEGREIPGWRLLGLDGGRKYRMLRHPDELKKAARTFSNVPLLSEHAKRGAPHRPELVIGAVASDPHFDGDLLKAGMCIWSAAAIWAIQSGERRQLSCAYAYSLPSMTRGTWMGAAYDGKMVDLRGTHVALVEEGRAGPECAIMLEDYIDGKDYAVA
jgi:hypothetical protein